MKKPFFLLILLVIVSMAAAQTYRVDMTTYSNKDFKWRAVSSHAVVELYGATTKATWIALTKALVMNDWVIRTQDEQSGIMTAEKSCSIPNLATGGTDPLSYSVFASVSESDTKVTVDLEGTMLARGWIRNILKKMLSELREGR